MERMLVCYSKHGNCSCIRPSTTLQTSCLHRTLYGCEWDRYLYLQYHHRKRYSILIYAFTRAFVSWIFPYLHELVNIIFGCGGREPDLRKLGVQNWSRRLAANRWWRFTKISIFQPSNHSTSPLTGYCLLFPLICQLTIMNFFLPYCTVLSDWESSVVA